MCNCNCRWSCYLFAIVSAVILGVVAAFLQISGTVTVGTTFLWVALGVGVVYLLGLVVASTTHRCGHPTDCCSSLNALLAGILGTILFSLVLLAVGIVATSVTSAALVGVLVFFLWLTVASAACFVRCTADCD